MSLLVQVLSNSWETIWAPVKTYILYTYSDVTQAHVKAKPASRTLEVISVNLLRSCEKVWSETCLLI